MLYSVNFEKLLRDLKDVAHWYEAQLGIPVKESRLEEIISLIEKTEDARKNNKIQEFVNQEGMERLYVPIYDAGAFPIIKEAFGGFKLGVLRKRDLEEIIKGPLNPSDEETGTGKVTPRNKLFELFLAALVHKAGIEVVGFDDIKIKIKSRNMFIECKRLGSKNEDRIKNNLIEASRQIDQKIKNSNNKKSRGIIALSIEKLFPFYGRLENLQKREDGSKFLKDEMHKWLMKNLEFLWRSIPDRRIIGLVVFSRYLAMDTSSNYITAFNNTIFASRREEKLLFGDKNLVETFSKKMHLGIEGPL